MTEHVVASGDARLHVVDQGGPGPVVLLLHGGGRSLSDFDDISARLTHLGYRCVSFDLRGHGRTPVAPWSWSAALADVAAVTAALQLPHPALVGHSLGGMVAALWAAEHPECPLAVNIDGHGNPTSPAHYADLDATEAAAAHQAVERALAPMARALPSHLATVMDSIDELDLYAAYRSVRSPLVLIRGEQSMAALLPPDAQRPWQHYEAWVLQQLQAAARANEHVEVLSLPTGHDAHLEAPERVVSLVRSRVSV